MAESGGGYINLSEDENSGDSVVGFDPLCSQKSACMNSLPHEQSVVDS